MAIRTSRNRLPPLDLIAEVNLGFPIADSKDVVRRKSGMK